MVSAAAASTEDTDAHIEGFWNRLFYYIISYNLDPETQKVKQRKLYVLE